MNHDRPVEGPDPDPDDTSGADALDTDGADPLDDTNDADNRVDIDDPDDGDGDEQSESA
jgi:hypothetical protein